MVLACCSSPYWWTKWTMWSKRTTERLSAVHVGLAGLDQLDHVTRHEDPLYNRGSFLEGVGVRRP